jgi:alkylated DNA nucleotide flippase Atl1
LPTTENTTGYVDALFSKTAKGQPMISPHNDMLNLRAGLGIEGDINADPISPRQILLVSYETMAAFRLNCGDLRENIVIRNFDLDRLPSGTLLQIGDSAVVRLTFRCEVCKYISTLPVRSIKFLEGRRGYLGIILQDGIVRPNDKVKIVFGRFRSVPERFYDRFLWIIEQIPTGKVITYSQLLRILGGSQPYFRIIPAFIKRASSTNYPIHRIVDSKGKLIRHVHNQHALLASEGISMEDSTVNVSEYSWDVRNLYYI